MSLFNKASRRSHQLLAEAFDQDRDDAIAGAKTDCEPVVEGIVARLVSEANAKYAARKSLIDYSRFDFDISMPDNYRDRQVLKSTLESDAVRAISEAFNRPIGTFTFGVSGFPEEWQEKRMRHGENTTLNLSVSIHFIPPLDPHAMEPA